MSDQKKKKPKKKKASIILFFIELIVLLALVCGIFIYAKINEGLGQIGKSAGTSATSVINQGAETVNAANGGVAGQGTVSAQVQQDPALMTADASAAAQTAVAADPAANAAVAVADPAVNAAVAADPAVNAAVAAADPAANAAAPADPAVNTAVAAADPAVAAAMDAPAAQAPAQTVVAEGTQMLEGQAAMNTAGVENAQATGATTLSGEAVTHVGTDVDPNADADAAEENEGISANETLRGYTNVLLVGIDTRDINQIDYANSDTMIIASINNDTSKVRMVSIYRDTLLNIQDNYSMSLGQGDSDEEPEGEAVAETVTAGEEDIVYFDEGGDEGGGGGEDYYEPSEDYGGGEDEIIYYDDSGDEGGGGGEDYSSDNGGGSEDNSGSGDGGSSNSGSDNGGSAQTAEPAQDTSQETNNGGNADTVTYYDDNQQQETDNTAEVVAVVGNDTVVADVTEHTESNTAVYSEPDSEVSEYAGNEYYNYTESGNETTGTQLGATTAAGRYDKANAAYANGSTKQLLSMLNKNLDLNIHDIVVVDFSAVAKLVDDIGGIDVWMTFQEVVHMNNYCQETSKVTGLDYIPIEPEEMPREYHLNGVQAVSYARIRYTAGNDMKRTQRQRVVIQKVIKKAKARGFDAVTGMINDVFPLCKTSFSTAEIIKLATQVFGFSIEKTTGFPFEHIEKNVYIGDRRVDAVVPVTLETNVQELHEFLFDDSDYECSATVKEYSNDISVLSGLTIASRDIAVKNSVIEESGGEADVVD